VEHGCQILTLGQYLRPSPDHLPIARYYTPAEFADLKIQGERMGFQHVEAGPLVRSSYHARHQLEKSGVRIRAARVSKRSPNARVQPTLG